MFKIIIMGKRRAGLTIEQFANYYKTRHLPLLATTLPGTGPAPTSIRVSIVKSDAPFLKHIEDVRTEADPPFDCITEAEFASREDAEAAMKIFFDPQYLEKIKDDERNFTDLRTIRYYVVESLL